MLKYMKLLSVVCILMLQRNVKARPQDIQETAILAFAQVKDTFDNGAAAKDTKEFELFGAKMKNNMEVGFGDAIKSKRSANVSEFYDNIVNSSEKLMITKRAIDDNNTYEEDGSYAYDDSSMSSSSSESDDLERVKRSPSAEYLTEMASSERFSNDIKNIYLQKK